jgi:hypothetical protein
MTFVTESNQRSWGGNGAFTRPFSMLDFHIIATPNPIDTSFRKRSKTGAGLDFFILKVCLTFHRDLTATRSPLDEADLEKIRLDDIFYRGNLFADDRGEGRESDRTRVE